MPLIGKQIILLCHDHDPDRVKVLLENRFHGILRPLDLALLRLESSSATATIGGPLFKQKPNPKASNS
ncbi:hypothetical protein DFAR_3170001 [Desulfarculales bacterium]